MATEMLQMLKNLEDEINSAKTVFGKVTIGLDKDECFMLLNKIRASLPEEVRRADRVTRDSDRIVNDAKEQASTTVAKARDEAETLREEARRQADQIVEQARGQQKLMLDESEVSRLAKAHADEILKTAEERARVVRQGADDYAYDTLTNLENAVGRVMTTIHNGKDRLERQPQQRVPAIAGRRGNEAETRD